MPGRSFQGPDGYRYGFNGKEQDPEVQGDGNQYDYGFRIYNPSIGKFLSVDPLMASFPMLTPYQYASNNPVLLIDLDGLEGVYPEQDPSGQGLKTQIEIIDEDHINGYNLVRVTVAHKKTNGQMSVVEMLIYQKKDRSKGMANWNYLNLFSSAHIQIALDASSLAGIVDPGTGYSGYNNLYMRKSERRRKSVVGIFMTGILDEADDFAEGKNQGYGMVFRHQVYSGILQAIYGSKMAKKVGDYNEMGNNGPYGLFKNKYGVGAVDLMNNAYGRQGMQEFIDANGGVNNIEDFTKYLNFAASRLIEYFDELDGAEVEFTSDMEGW